MEVVSMQNVPLVRNITLSYDASLNYSRACL